MNAGAEYVLYRIVGALQDEQGIHPESLLTCLGALAGYACRYAAGDGLNRPLTESPMSVWALVRRAVQKLGQPLPSFDERMPKGHRPRRPAVVYLRQLWPQVLPIAQRFCRKPTQLPVLFGIALQRAIEMTRELLRPTLAARIAMECAVAMSRVALPGDLVEVSDFGPGGLAASGAQQGTAGAQPPAARPPLAQQAPASRQAPVAEQAPMSRQAPTAQRAAGAVPAGAVPSPIAAALSGMRAEPLRRSSSGKRSFVADVSAPALWARLANRPAATLVIIAFVGVISVAGAKWRTGRSDATAEPARIERKLQVANAQSNAPSLFGSPEREPTRDAPPITAEQPPQAPRQQAEPVPPPVAQEGDEPILTPAQANEAKINEETQRRLDLEATGDSEMVPVAEFASSPPPSPPGSIPAESLF